MCGIRIRPYLSCKADISQIMPEKSEGFRMGANSKVVVLRSVLPKVIYESKSHINLEIEMKSILIALIMASCIFSIVDAQSNPHYMTTDPAIQEMLMAIDMHRSTGSSSFTSMTADPAIREMLISMNMPRYTGNVPVETIAGNWQLNFSEGDRIELALQQSGAAIFGRGTLTNSTLSQAAFASGSVSGSSLNLEVVPESATELYAISIDISSLPCKGTYGVFLEDSGMQTGTLVARKNAA